MPRPSRSPTARRGRCSAARALFRGTGREVRVNLAVRTDFTPDDQRWQLARRMLHDDHSGRPVADRVAACLVLLYAQPVARIAALTCDQIQTGPDGTVQLRLGHTDITVLAPLDKLLLRLPETKPRGTAAHLSDHDAWLFPGRQPGHHLGASSLTRRLAALGVNARPDRNGTLLTLARELPPTVIGKLLGLHLNTAVAWAQLAGSDWDRCAARHSRSR